MSTQTLQSWAAWLAGALSVGQVVTVSLSNGQVFTGKLTGEPTDVISMKLRRDDYDYGYMYEKPASFLASAVVSVVFEDH